MEEELKLISSRIKAEALRLGFAVCGIAKADRVPDSIIESYTSWIQANKQGDMSYLERNMELRWDPRLIVPNTKSIIVVALNYYPVKRQASAAPQFAYYAYGRDYHKVVKKLLNQLLDYIKQEICPQAEGRAFCDSAPILERYWAEQAGIGWKGKNGLIIIPRAGSYYFLGELLVDIELSTDHPVPSLCGVCTKCLHSCPTQALLGNGEIDARRCISYLTIEQSQPIPTELAQKMGNRIYGCDACQQCCPWNRLAHPTQITDFALRDVIENISPEIIEQMSPEDFSNLFAGSAVRRAGLSGLQRSLQAIQSNNTTDKT